MAMPDTVRTPSDISWYLVALGVEPGGTLLVHASYRSIRPVAGGLNGLIQALFLMLGRDGTLAKPCWSGDRGALFDAETTPTSEVLGALAESFRRFPGVQRGRHRFAFAAMSPKAREDLADPICPPWRRQSRGSDQEPGRTGFSFGRFV